MRIRRPTNIPHFKIDWPNHVIGFLSALFGILIAFELEEWRDQRKEQQLAQTAFENLRNEVSINKNMLHENVDGNLRMIGSLQQVLTKVDRNFVFKGTTLQADSINRIFRNVLIIQLADSSRSGRQLSWPVHFSVESISIPSMQSSAWESAKATGALNFLAYEKVAALSFVYNDAKINDALSEIRTMWRRTDDIKNKEEFVKLLSDMERAHRLVQRELEAFDLFVNMLETMQ